jgi:hypothetical protein
MANRHVAPAHRHHQRAEPSWVPWVWRAAETLLADGPEAIALGERDRDEVLAILGAAIDLVGERTRRRPRARRRRAA